MVVLSRVSRLLLRGSCVKCVFRALNSYKGSIGEVGNFASAAIDLSYGHPVSGEYRVCVCQQCSSTAVRSLSRLAAKRHCRTEATQGVCREGGGSILIHFGCPIGRGLTVGTGAIWQLSFLPFTDAFNGVIVLALYE